MNSLPTSTPILMDARAVMQDSEPDPKVFVAAGSGVILLWSPCDGGTAMWTQAHRARHEQSAADYPSSLTEAEWSELERLIPPARPGGRPRETDMRAASDAPFYLLRTGCPWRYLPRDGRFPPRSTVYNIFRGFQRDGVWEAIAATLVEAERQRQGREPDPSAGILDSQTARAAERGGLRRTRWATTLASGPRGASAIC